MGSVETVSEADGVETTQVQPDFELIAFDFVSNPSTQGAFMYPMNENVDRQGTVGRTCGDYCKAEDMINRIIRGE
jgi:flavin-dependent dehydrogenase